MHIIVNGIGHETEQAFLTYDQVIGIAGAKPGSSVTFRARVGPEAVRQGCLSTGCGVTLAEGMVFNVVMTGNA